MSASSPSLKQRWYKLWYGNKVAEYCKKIEVIFKTSQTSFERAPLKRGEVDPFPLKPVSPTQQIDNIIDDLSMMLGQINGKMPYFHPMVKVSYIRGSQVPLLCLLATSDEEFLLSVEKRWEWMQKLMGAGLSLDPEGLNGSYSEISTQGNAPETTLHRMASQVPLLCAIDSREFQMAYHMIKAGANVKGEKGRGALVGAMMKFDPSNTSDQYKLIDLLLEHPIDVKSDVKSSNYNTSAVRLSALQLNLNWLKKIHQMGATLDQEDGDGNGLLHDCVVGLKSSNSPAALEVFVEMTEWLIQKGVNLQRKNKNHKTPLEVALEVSIHPQAIAYLQGCELALKEKKELENLWDSKRNLDDPSGCKTIDLGRHRSNQAHQEGLETALGDAREATQRPSTAKRI